MKKGKCNFKRDVEKGSIENLPTGKVIPFLKTIGEIGPGIVTIIGFGFWILAHWEWALFGSLALLPIAVLSFCRFKKYPKKLAIIWALLGLVFSFGGWLTFEHFKNQSSNQTWEPPELSKGCKEVHILFGSQNFTYQVADLKQGRIHPSLTLVINDMQWPPFNPFLKNHRLYIRAGLYYKQQTKTFLMQSNSEVFQMNSDIDGKIPLDWDRNYSSNAMEIVSKNNIPILQVFYRRPEEIVVNGFFSDTNFVMSAFNGQCHFYKLPTTNELVFPWAKPIFKYPSWQHIGEYAN